MENDKQDLNEKNLQEFQEEVSNYLTDSDIEDPKYLPTLTKQNIESHQTQITQENLLYPLQEQIKSLKFDTDFKTKSLKEVENENNLLKTEIFKMQEQLNAKDIVIEEFQSLVTLTKNKFIQFEEKNGSLQLENESLMNQLDKYEKDLRTTKAQIEANASNSKNIKVYEDHISELQSEYNQRETKLNKRYQEKESSLKAEYLNEIAKISKELDELKVEKEKSKYEISTYKIKVDELQSQLEDKEYEYTSEIARKAKDNKKLADQINELNEKMNQMEIDTKHKVNLTETSLQDLKDAKNSLMQESASKDEHIIRLEDNLIEAKHDIEMMTHELKELNSKCENKDVIIDQMRNQNDAMYKELSMRESEIMHQEELKQNEVGDYNDQLNIIMREKNDIEAQNAELIDNLAIANEQLKKMNDLITDKYSTMEMSLYKQSSKNENLEKKYKGLIKQLKHKEKSLYQENKSLKEQINQRDYEKDQMEYQYQNDMKNVSFYNCQNYGLGNATCNNNNNIMNNTSPLIYTQANPNIMNNSMSVYDMKEEEQKKTLEEFKRLLSKIDEKLDLPIKNI